MAIKRTTMKADAVLSVSEDMFSSEIDECEDDFYVYPYKNGREKGYKITTWFTNRRTNERETRSVFFSEFRRSDEIVVYVSRGTYSDEITEEMYNNAKFFSSTSYVQAAKYIWRSLMK